MALEELRSQYLDKMRLNRRYLLRFNEKIFGKLLFQEYFRFVSHWQSVWGNVQDLTFFFYSCACLRALPCDER